MNRGTDSEREIVEMMMNNGSETVSVQFVDK